MEPPTTTEWLEIVKELKMIGSDYQLAERLKTTRQAISQQKKGLSEMSVKTATLVALELGLDPMLVIAACEYHRESPGITKNFWRKIYNSKL